MNIGGFIRPSGYVCENNCDKEKCGSIHYYYYSFKMKEGLYPIMVNNKCYYIGYEGSVIYHFQQTNANEPPTKRSRLI